MSLLYNSRPFTSESKQHAIQTLVANATPDRDYYLLLVGSILLAIGAIFTDSVAVLIASMIVAPLSSPILLLGFGVAARSWYLIGRAVAILLTSGMVAVVVALLITMKFGSERVPDLYISFNGNNGVATAVAVVSGVIAAYGLLRPKVASAITGIAIAVSLMPPLVATGIGLAPGGAPFRGCLSAVLVERLGYFDSQCGNVYNNGC